MIVESGLTEKGVKQLYRLGLLLQRFCNCFHKLFSRNLSF